MARHRSPDSATRLSKELIIALIVILALIVAAIAWFILRGTTSQEHDSANACPQGELSVPYALVGTLSEPQELIDAFLATHPVVQDNCVTAIEKTSVDKAAFLITDAGTPQTFDSIKTAQRTAATDSWTTMAYDEVGIAYPSGTSVPPANWSDNGDISLIKEQPGAAATAAAALSSARSEQAQQLLGRATTQDDALRNKRPFATLSGSLPADYQFAVPTPHSAWPTRIVPLNYAGSVTEEQARAAKEFAKFAGERLQPSAQSGDTDIATMALGLTAIGSADAPSTSSPMSTPSAAQPSVLAKDTDTLVLLDTSNNMNADFGGKSIFNTVAPILADKVRAIGGAGAQVGLWNYSSPLNPGVAKGWRNNVSLPDASSGANAANAIPVFGTGGIPNTHEAVVAAQQTAGEYGIQSTKPVRVLVVTTGTADQAPLPDHVPEGVTIDVVHVGNGPVDELLKTYVEAHGGSLKSAKSADELSSELDAALGL